MSDKTRRVLIALVCVAIGFEVIRLALGAM